MKDTFRTCGGIWLRLLAMGMALHCAGAAIAAEGKLVVHPPALELSGLDRQHGLLVTLVEPDGHCVDVTRQVKLSSSDAKVLSIGNDGSCEALADGKAEIVAQLGALSARVPVVVKQTGVTPPPSFRQDVLPVLTRTGCNTGSCHGKLAGQNGFKLSLRGYAPEWDYDSLRTDLWSRRINPAFADASLMIQKPLGKVPHEGGRRFDEGSRYHETLAEWVKHRAPGPIKEEADAMRLEVLPGNRTLRIGQTQQLLVRAHYADGRVRDVTWLSQFYSAETPTVSVDAEGMVKALRSGETAVRVHFQGLVEVVMVTTPYAAALEPSLFARRNNIIDEHVFSKLAKLGIPPSPDCDDTTFMRRAFLDLTGTLPGPEEVRAFMASTDPEKRAKLVDDLLGRPEFVDYWTLQLSDLLQNRKERDHDVRGAKGVRQFQAWLRGEVAANRPWDRLARSVLTAKGDTTSSPAIGYFVVTVGEKQRVEESEVADSVAQAFLGARIGCARCHNHPLEKHTQDDYYRFAAFFAKMSLKRQDANKGPTMLVLASREEMEQRKQLDDAQKKLVEAEAAAKDKAGEELKQATKKVEEATRRVAEVRKRIDELAARPPAVQQPRTRQSVTARPLDGRELAFKAGGDARETLADWMTDPKNELFSGNMVNRLWRHFMGVGLVEPVDDLRSSNPPSNPELWKALNSEFVSHGYDIRHVMRLIILSRAYQLSSTTLPGNELDRRFFSHYIAKRLPAEVLLDAVSSATQVPDKFDGYPLGTRAVQLPEPGVGSYFLTLFGRSDRVTACACERSGDVTLPQLLHLRNGEELHRKMRDGDGRLAKLLKSGDEAGAVQELFLATLSRLPRESEAAAVKQALASGDPREEVLRDLFWALMNSKEFAFNH